MRHRRLKDQLAGDVDAHRAEPRLRVKADGMDVVRSHEETDATAAGDPAEPGHDARHGCAAETPTLAAPVEREPAEPPARRIAPVRMHHVEPDYAAVGLHGDQRVRQPLADGGDDVGQRTEEAINLGLIDVKGQYAPEVGTADARVDERLSV